MLKLQKHIRWGRSAQKSANRLVLGDNLEVAKTLNDESIQSIYLDPPFGTGVVQKGPRSSYRDSLSDPNQLMTWLEPRLVECRRCLAQTGSLFLHLDHRSVHYAKVLLDRLFGRSRFINEIIWCYSVGGRSKRRFARKHDSILWYSKSKDYAFYPDSVRVARKASSHMRVVRDGEGNTWQEKTDKKTGRVYRYPVSQGKVPEDWWSDIETLNRSDKERIGWPTQKPIRLLERIILATTAPGDRVGDFFMGSGTSVVAAQKHQRTFLGVDANSDSIQCALERLIAEASSSATFQPPSDILVESFGTTIELKQFFESFDLKMPRQGPVLRGNL